jgi:hypothetical protein
VGRELRRVPLDFKWPLNKVWGGYINPFANQSTKCTACDGTAYSPEAKRIEDQWYGNAPFDPVAYGATPLTVDNPTLQAFARQQCERDGHYYGTSEADVQRNARRLWQLWRYQWCHHLIQADVDALVAKNRLWDFTRRPRNAEQVEKLKAQEAAGESHYWLKEPNGHHPTADEVNAWSMVSMGHDAINRWTCVEARILREGVERYCKECDGQGAFWPPGVEAQYEAWESSEPPTGPGFQLWETTSEGSPVSPVFTTLDELCAYAEKNCSTFGTHNFVSKERWKEMLDNEHVYHQEGNMVFL